MKTFRFAVAVGVTSLVVVLALGFAGVLVVRDALASGPWGGFVGAGGPPLMDLPPEVKGLHDLPPAERFKHFSAAQISLTDKDNKPLTIQANPGTVTSVSGTSLTLAANDGTTKNYALNDKTTIRGKVVQGGSQASQPTLAKDDKVVVITMNNGTTANAVIVGGADGFGPGRWHGRG